MGNRQEVLLLTLDGGHAPWENELLHWNKSERVLMSICNH